MTDFRDAYRWRVRAALRRDLAAAIKVRDSVSVSALRSALGAIENAETVDGATPPPATQHSDFAGSVAGLGKAEVDRQVLGDGEVELLVREEVQERQLVALDLDRAGHHQRAARLRAEADILLRYLPQ